MPTAKNPTSSRRSANMRAIRSVGNKTTELRIRGILAQHHIGGWTLHPKGLVGFPDIYFPKKRVAVFVDGCFWHCCPRCGHTPRTNKEYWASKLVRNKKRDRANSKALRAAGYRVIRLWECHLRLHPNRCLLRILRGLNQTPHPS